MKQYKVIEDFPQWSVFKHEKGDILELRGIHYVGKSTAKAIHEDEIDKYPHLFQKVEEEESTAMPVFSRPRVQNHPRDNCDSGWGWSVGLVKKNFKKK